MEKNKSVKIKILHITPHLGAGVGTVVLNYLAKAKNSPNFEHRVVCLDYANEKAIEVARSAGFPLSDNMSKKKSELLGLIADSDIVLIHWWNHPLLYDLLMREELPQSRVIFWAHQRGYPPPNNFTDKIFRYPDIFVFTTPLSYGTKEVRNLTGKQRKKIRAVWSTGGVERIKSIKLKKHSSFNIGYIGTVDYAKMHPDFLDICSRINIPNVKFIVVGGPNGKQMEQEAERRGIGEKFNFTGFISEKEKWDYLSVFDIFGYPLAQHHYGSCDQVLQESMAVGVAPIVLANPMESYMVENGVTGIVAKDKKEYIKAVENLYYNHKLRDSLSRNAKKYATHTFSLKKMANEWDKIYNEALNIPKTIKKWETNKKTEDITPGDMFLESLGGYGKVFVSYCNAKNAKEKMVAVKKIKKMAESANWQSKTKSSVHQYNYFFPNDHYISIWSKLMMIPVSQ